ncbi:Cytoplasmic tRNA 2-thiolation protein 1 [Ceratocystis fimbriata CBS 114723]|uniref:Cytoplasmic tRNA 2-thiolation protein 1 n=1 Tax=Ceratocystis fimbriata CBS 114723 TaxID=1035309 RepID=A0A2C5WWG4_9PEZI|nr:Cytoplasmic tRNA 2-thiolation protein 1 [Ceratocystis fimbriata CBS 114723]
MLAPTCAKCKTARASVKRPKNHDKLCKTCFIHVFEEEVHHTITASNIFHPGERVAIGASGGKDSTVLASVLNTLNTRHNYGLELVLLSIDEGITGYRDDSLETVKQNSIDYNMPLTIVGYGELYGWTMDEVVEVIGKKGNCTYCGVFRRQALDRGAKQLGIKHIVTGHNADDTAETILMNLLRADVPRLSRSTSIVTGTGTEDVKRSKPLKYCYEKEIVLYAHYKKLLYFSTECLYSPEAFRGTARALIKNLEKVRPCAILDIVRSGEDMATLVGQRVETGYQRVNSKTTTSANSTCDSKHEQTLPRLAAKSNVGVQMSPLGHHQPSAPTKSSSSVKHHVALQQTAKRCGRCGFLSSQSICQACMLLEGLNTAREKLS